MQKMTFEELPEMMVQVIEKLDKLMQPIIPQATPPKQFVNQKELCRLLNITEPTAIRWCNKGKIPFMKIGNAKRFELNEVFEALNRKTK